MTCDAGGENPFSRCFITKQAMGLFKVELSDSLSGDGDDFRHTSSPDGVVVQLIHDTPQCVLGMEGQEAATAAAAACE